MDEEQAYMFDLNGYIVLPGLLTGEQIEELKADAKGVENNGPSSCACISLLSLRCVSFCAAACAPA